MSSQDLLTRHPFEFYIRRHTRFFGLGISCLLITNLLDAITPLLMQQAIDHLIGNHSLNDVARTCVLYFLTLLGLATFRFLWRVFFSRFHHNVADDLRRRVYDHLTQMGPSFFQKNPVGSLMQLISNDVNTFRMGIGPGVLILFDGLFLTLFILPFMIHMSWSWTWKTLIFLPAVPFIIQKIEAFIHVTYKVQQDDFAETSGRAQEMIMGVRLIKSFAQERKQLFQFNEISEKLEVSGNRFAYWDSLFQPVLEVTVGIGSVILLYIASPEVIRQSMTIGTMVAFQQYIQKLVWPMAAFGAGLSMTQQGLASYDRIRNFLSTPSDQVDDGTVEIKEFRSLKVINVSFRYPNTEAWALKNVSFQIERGESLGLIGEVGSGKSTLLHVLCRMWPVQEGQILVNDLPIEQIKRSSLYEHFSVVTQDPFLFSETVRENVGFGNVSNDRVLETLGSVQLREEIESMPLKDQSLLGERGVNLSGGQKQRLTIARALTRGSTFYLFDDALSAVDQSTERKIIEAVSLTKDHSSRPSFLIISHRLQSVKELDRILVLSKGSVEAYGSYEEIFSSSHTLQAIAKIQDVRS